MITSNDEYSGEFYAVSARLVELERERSDAQDQINLLMSLQEAYAQIAVTRAPVEVISLMLRTAYRSLGFSRAIYFAADRGRRIEARWQIDGGDVVEESRESPDLRPGSALLSALRTSGSDVGRAVSVATASRIAVHARRRGRCPDDASLAVRRRP